MGGKGYSGVSELQTFHIDLPVTNSDKYEDLDQGSVFRAS